MFNEIKKRIEKVNEQRVAMAALIVNVMKLPNVDIRIKSAMAASIMDMLETSMIEEDKSLIEFLMDGIESVNTEARQFGVNNLSETIDTIRKSVKEKKQRVNEGESILNSLNLDNINLN